MQYRIPLNIFAVVWRDVLVCARQRSTWLIPIAFFCVVALMFPLGLSPQSNVLQEIAPALLWIICLLSILLSLPQLLASDKEDGTLEQLLLSCYPAELWILLRILTHWFLIGVPLILAGSMIMFIMFNIKANVLAAMMQSLLLGTPILSCLGMLGAGLTVGLKHSGLLLTLLILPLYVPVVIVGTGIAAQASLDIPISGYLALLFAGLIASLLIIPWVTAAVLRCSSEI